MRRENQTKRHRCDCVYEDYEGLKLWDVMHPRHRKVIRVAAPDEAAAIVAAAGFWKERWTDYEFYPNCKVYRIS